MSTFGTIFRVTTFGESHSTSVGVVVDGCPPKMPLSEADIQPQLTRRRPGQSKITTSRAEMDIVKIHCGIEEGYTLGTPIMLLVTNKDYVKKDYFPFKNVPRPSHADFTYKMKYGINASSGGGRASARETIGRIAAGSIAEKWLKNYYGIEIVAFVSSVGKISAPDFLLDKTVNRNSVDKNIFRCPDKKTAEEMIELIKTVKESGDSIGGIVTCICRNVPVGLGEPVFDKIKAKLAQAMLSIPACTGFDYGSGFKGTESLGSQNNDPFEKCQNGSLTTKSNNSGGIQGGITNGNDIVFRVAFKPVSTILQPQKTVDYDGVDVELLTKGRHDPCVLPRAVPIVESMAAVVLIDAALIQIQRKESVLKGFDLNLNA